MAATIAVTTTNHEPSDPALKHWGPLKAVDDLARWLELRDTVQGVLDGITAAGSEAVAAARKAASDAIAAAGGVETLAALVATARKARGGWLEVSPQWGELSTAQAKLDQRRRAATEPRSRGG